MEIMNSQKSSTLNP